MRLTSVLILDLSGQIKRSNEAAEFVAGPVAEELTGKNIAELGEGHPGKRQRNWSPKYSGEVSLF